MAATGATSGNQGRLPDVVGVAATREDARDGHRENVRRPSVVDAVAPPTTRTEKESSPSDVMTAWPLVRSTVKDAARPSGDTTRTVRIPSAEDGYRSRVRPSR